MGRKLYVGNLGYSVTTDDLKELFGQIGSCESIAIINDRDTGQSKRFGFVEMTTDAEAQKAIPQLNSKDFKGRALNVTKRTSARAAGIAVAAAAEEGASSKLSGRSAPVLVTGAAPHPFTRPARESGS